MKVDLPEDGTVTCKENEDLELKFEDIPEDADVSFFFGRKNVEDMGRSVITRMGRTHIFFIGGLNTSDSGKYRVEIENEGGKIEKEFKIDVKGNKFGQYLVLKKKGRIQFTLHCVSLYQ